MREILVFKLTISLFKMVPSKTRYNDQLDRLLLKPDEFFKKPWCTITLALSMLGQSKSCGFE